MLPKRHRAQLCERNLSHRNDLELYPCAGEGEPSSSSARRNPAAPPKSSSSLTTVHGRHMAAHKGRARHRDTSVPP